MRKFAHALFSCAFHRIEHRVFDTQASCSIGYNRHDRMDLARTPTHFPMFVRPAAVGFPELGPAGHHIASWSLSQSCVLFS